MPPLRLMPSPMSVEPGDLHAEIAGDALCIPQALAAEAAAHGLRTASDLVAYAMTFPSAVARCLDWSVADVERAVTRLTAQLTAHDPAHAALSARRQEPAYGAMNPDDLPR